MNLYDHANKIEQAALQVRSKDLPFASANCVRTDDCRGQDDHRRPWGEGDHEAIHGRDYRETASLDRHCRKIRVHTQSIE